MRKKGKQWDYIVIGLVLSLFFLPFVSAYARTGVSPLDNAIEIVSNLFNIRALDNSYVQEGFLKLMIFISIFALSHAALKIAFSKFDNSNKVAGIIAFSFSMIGVFMMPTEWLYATGATITAIMSSLIFMGVFWGLAYVAMRYLTGDWMKNLFGLLLLLLLLFLIQVWADATNMPAILLVSTPMFRRFTKWQ